MKDSGIDWIGKIPDEWEIYQLSQVVTQVKNKNTNLQEKNLLSLSYGKIKRKNIDSNDGLLPASFDGYNIIENEDIVLRLTDLQNDHTSLRVGRATEKGIITSAYTTLRPMNKDNSRFLYYLLHAFDLKKGFYGMGAGVRQGLNYSEVKSLKIILPNDKSEQTKIANFLDKKCAQIDSIIEESKKSIEEYKAWKQSMIFEAVTGKNLSCKKKDSGIEWLGEIPEEWEVCQIKRFVDLFNGQEIKKEIPKSEKSIDVYGSGGIFKYTEEYLYNGEAVLFGRKGSIGKPIIVKGKFWTVDTMYYSVCKKAVADNYFFYYLLKIFPWDFFATKTALPSIVGSEVFNQFVSLPPLSEQESIAKALDAKCVQIDSLISEKQSLIKDLAEYKKSLIFEAVTGKRRV